MNRLSFRGLRRGAAVAAALTLSLSLAACGGDSGDDAEGGSDGGLTEITVGSIPILDVAPLYLAQEKGFFEEEGLDATIKSAQGGAVIIPSVAEGSYEFGMSNTTSLLVGTSQGIPLQATGPCSNATGDPAKDMGAIMVGKGSDIKRPKDLEGKKVAVNTLKNINEETVAEVVKRDGGDPSTIDFVELAFPDILPAIESGDVAAGEVVEPFVTIGKSQGMQYLISNLAELSPDMQVAMYFTSDKYAAENPETVEAFTNALTKANEYATENPDEARKILNTYTEIDPETQKNVTLPAWPTEIDQESVELLNQLNVDYGYVDEAANLDDLLP